MAKILFATTAEGVKFYPITITDAIAHISGANQTKLSDILSSLQSDKANKLPMSGAGAATEGNFISISSTGDLADSGKKAADFKPKQTAVTDPSVPATGTTTAVAFIDSITQDANGVITPTKKNVPTVAASSSGVGGNDGLMTASQAEQLAALVSTGGEVNVLEGVKVNGTELTIDSNKKVNVTIAQGTTDGTIAANGVDVSVKGLDSAAFAKTTDFDAAGTAAGLIEALDATPSQAAGTDGLALSITEVDGVITAISGSIAANTYDSYGAAADVLGTASDTATANTVYGAKAYADSLVQGGIIYKGVIDGSTTTLPASNYKKGDYYKVGVAGTYAGHVCQVGDALIANKDYVSGAVAASDWDLLQGNVAVTNSNASLVIGTATKIAEVEGTEIKVTQVEDMTKIEAVAVADTTDYADVTSLFTAPV